LAKQAPNAPREPIDGVSTKSLRVIPDQRGRLMEILRCDDEMFEQFGQVYITTAYPGVVKGWHYHKIQTDHLAVVQGMALVAVYDQREGSPTFGHVNEFYSGIHKPLLIRVPPGVLHGFKCISEHEAVFINIPTHPYRYDHPDEYRIGVNDPSIPYCWERVDA